MIGYSLGFAPVTSTIIDLVAAVIYAEVNCTSLAPYVSEPSHSRQSLIFSVGILARSHTLPIRQECTTASFTHKYD